MQRGSLRGTVWALPAVLLACAHGLGVDDPYPRKTGATATVGSGGSSGAGTGGGGVAGTVGSGGNEKAGTGGGGAPGSNADAAGGTANPGTPEAAAPDVGPADASIVDAAVAVADASDASRVDTGPASDGAVGSALPLSTCGRWIVDKNQRRVKLAGVNWYGASDTRGVVGGLDKVPLAQLVNTIRDLGFNTVRLPFSNEMLHVSGSVSSSAVSANSSLAGKKPLDVFDAVVSALTNAEIFVILVNNSTHAMECCAYDEDAFWFTSDYTEASWIADWETLAARYASNPRVVGADLRQEPRPYRVNLLATSYVNWGQGGSNDWAAAAKRAGDRVLAKNPNLIVFVEGIDAADNLTAVRSRPLTLQVPNKLSYEAHQYATFPPFPGDTSVPYGSMSAAELKGTCQAQWGFLLDPAQTFAAPVLLGEFGASTQSSWLTNLEGYMRELDMDFTFWVLNATKTNGSAEPFALLESDWTTVKRDARLTALQGMQKAVRGPGIDPADTCTAR